MPPRSLMLRRDRDNGSKRLSRRVHLVLVARKLTTRRSSGLAELPMSATDELNMARSGE